MVWSLVPADPLSGEEKYYIYAKGTYKVGRKGCDVTIGNDKAVSRIHAEIIVDVMESYKPMSAKKSSKVRIRDCSKYGTFISRNSNAKEKVHECPGKEMHLNDGDLIAFGTGSLIFRFSYVPLVFYLCNFTSSQGTPSTQDRVSSLGACVTHGWTSECTHVIVDPFMPVNDGIVDAILSKKPLVLSTWLEFIAESRIRNEIPSYSSYIPTLTLEGASVTVADYRTRENCLSGYTFLLDSATKYRFQDKLQLLLEIAGAKVLSIEDFDSNSQVAAEGDNNRVVFVNPATLVDRFLHRSSLFKVKEVDIISGVISGHLDPSVIISPSIVVSSSCSTGETVVADSDAETETETETETATSDQLIIPNAVVNSYDEIQRKKKIDHVDRTSEVAWRTDSVQQRDRKMTSDSKVINSVQREDSYTRQHAQSGEHVKQFVELNRGPLKVKDNELESLNSDVLFSQNLIVRDAKSLASTGSVSQHGVVNFKRFRKAHTQSGNSFSNLIPFSKFPYSDADYDKEINEYVKEEKRRKQKEAVADDLFNNEKGRRRGAAGSLRGLLGLN